MSESVAYLVEDERVNLYITIMDIDSLHLHEKIIPQLLEQLARTIKADGVVKHPIIVDRESLVVLDGVHRVAALKKLGIKRIPVCLVDYRNPRIKVFSWHRTITDASTPEHILAQVKQTGSVMRKIVDFDEASIGVSPTVAAVKFRNKTFLINFSFQNLREAYNIIECIEENLKASRLRVKYETELDALTSLREGRVDAVLYTPRLSKQEIVAAAISGQSFASKATRHVIPARPMRLNVSLNLLRDEKKPLSEANEELNRMLQKRHLKRAPSGSLIDGRRYEEELYIFEE